MKRSKLFSLTTIALALVIAFSALAPVPVQARPAAPNSIVDIALAVNAQTGEFSTLIAALQTAGLVDTLASRGQYTVFAPTDAAFSALGLNASNISSLPVEALTNILLYHVSPGKRTSDMVVASDRLRMLNKDFTLVSVGEDGVFINQARIVEVDIIAGNGVIHIIDSVLLP
jgi:uncharacterized surface protein with fasciclin (FAS1) repeats